MSNLSQTGSSPMANYHQGANPSLTTKPNNQNFTVDWHHVTSNNFHIDFAPLNEHVNERSMRYTNIGIPFHNKASIAQLDRKNFNIKNEKNAVAFAVEGRPYDTQEGRKLVRKLPEMVRDPLKWDHVPHDATITYYEKDDVPKIRRDIHKCIITGVELLISPEDNMVVVRFYLVGLMEKSV